MQSPISLISNFLRNTIDSSITIAKIGKIIKVGNSGIEGDGEIDGVGKGLEVGVGDWGNSELEDVILATQLVLPVSNQSCPAHR